MNKNILKIHHEVLDEKRIALLGKLLPYTNGLILGGGTALALQLVHRKSFDFDFFSNTSLKKKLIEELSQGLLIERISTDTSQELTFFTQDDIKITFLHYPFSHAFPLEVLKNKLQLFSVRDIAVQKAYTIGRRGEYRDYFDLYCILKNNYTNLREVILSAKKIYGSVFEEKIFLQQLVYFNDLLNFEIIPLMEPFPTPNVVKSFFKKLVTDYIAR